MRTGYSSATFDVPTGTPLGGYEDRHSTSAGTLDDLRLQVLSWSDDVTRVVIVVIDIVCVNADLTQSIRAAISGADKRVSAVWVMATHTHSGPETGCVPGGASTPEPWLTKLTRLASACALEAVESEQPSRGVWRHGTLVDVASVRGVRESEAEIPFDLVAVAGVSGPLGLILVVPIHPTVLPADNLLVSADLPGKIRTELQARIGEDAWVVVLTGAAGDVSTRHTRLGQTPAELDRLGALTASQISDALRTAGTTVWEDGERIRQVHLVGALSARSTGPVEVEISTTVPEDEIDLRIQVTLAQGRDRLLALPPDHGPYGFEAGVLSIGRMRWITMPGEPTQKVAERALAGLTGPVSLIGYANAYPGYLVTSDDSALSGYEGMSSVVAPAAVERLADDLNDLARTMFQTKGDLA